ncbi:MAG: NAD(P)/FAD-dependent oxidoreductase [Gammaproteobacteria bacterium]|nr:NAD(P)/FAD-dependent oxidoreductase [Gammaproteobacteria bacterium]
MTGKRALIIGAGPAGLTAAYELMRRSDIQPLVFEMSEEIGGISKTVNYKGNRIDIGGHRFFSKSDRVMNWWTTIMPVAGTDAGPIEIHYQGGRRALDIGPGEPPAEQADRVFLVRNRLSRIFYLRRFFEYPLSLGLATIKKLGVMRTLRVGFSYLRSVAFPIREEHTLEDFLINRFGRQLYLTFFKDYTEKVWGVSCREIGAEWGAQRIKGLSITRLLLHAVKQLFGRNGGSVSQKGTETSLIERFLYPKFGPGQMWEAVAQQVIEGGGEVNIGWRATGLEIVDGGISVVELTRPDNGERRRVSADYVFSTMPVRELIAAMGAAVPSDVRQIAQGLEYRDFITVGMLLRRLRVAEDDLSRASHTLPDNWIYIQERDVKVGRVQVFNNWSPYMVADSGTVWIGLEYFCNEGDELWSLQDGALVELATEEMERIGFIERADLLDTTVIRMPKAYPGYFGEAYTRFDRIRAFTDGLENLFLIGRNGMHRYNNQDHSMLSAMVAVDNILAGSTAKDNIWNVNTESDYHEQR